ncbi:unnamed protein product [Cuscuta europaea]|uniref:FAR1 domain-containing protein n=1 Tax=Cuscuta europaea TaxID=41803 RepID=A0A9P0YQ31_CUSEU|nr:unnamed protein product [Cuscuta europaea]
MMSTMEASNTYVCDNEIRRTWEKIFGHSPGETSTPAATEGGEHTTEGDMQGHEHTKASATEGVEHTPAATLGDERTTDGKAVDAELDADEHNNREEDINVVVPEVSMIFDTTDAVFEFYKTYGRSLGFPVRKEHQQRIERRAR